MSLSIAAASIVAKVARDALMRRLDAAHPGYGFARHAGYPTREHAAALRGWGPARYTAARSSHADCSTATRGREAAADNSLEIVDSMAILCRRRACENDTAAGAGA